MLRTSPADIYQLTLPPVDQTVADIYQLTSTRHYRPKRHITELLLPYRSQLRTPIDMKPGPPKTRKRILPTGCSERVLCLFLFVATPLIPIFEFFLVVPRYHGSLSLIVCVHTILTMFIAMNVLGNMAMVLKVDTSLRKPCRPGALLPSWRYCQICKQNAPPRSYHCPTCDECILKRDHHCMFLGRCVGYFSHRYFLMGLLYLIIGTFYSQMYHYQSCTDAMGAPWPVLFALQMVPYFGLYVGFLEPLGFACAAVNVVEELVVVFGGCLLATQAWGIYKNQTTYERRHSILRYNVGLKRNIEATLGTSWFLTWICPWIKSTLAADGARFVERGDALLRIDTTEEL